MGITVRKDLLIAAVIAIAIHAGVSLLTVHGTSAFPLRENKVNRNLEISFVSTYKEVKKVQPVVKKKKRVQKVETSVRKKVQQVERKDRYIKPVETIKVQEEMFEPVVQETQEVETGSMSETKNAVKVEQSEDTVQIIEEEKPVWEKPGKEVKILQAVPDYSENPPPSYPPVARRRGYEGMVMLSVNVLADGSVGELRIKDTSGYSILDRAAVRAVKKWKFKPALREDVPVPMWVEVPVRFLIK